MEKEVLKFEQRNENEENVEKGNEEDKEDIQI